MATFVRKRWLDPMRPSDIRSHMQDMLDHGWVSKQDMITAVLDPKRFQSSDHGEFPEDDHEVAAAMSEHHEWFCNVFRIRAVWEMLAARGTECLTFHDLDQIMLWTYRC